jgi:hypothetical protein
MKAMVTGKATGPEQMRWNFGDSRDRFLSLDEFLEQKEAEGVEFFAGKEPWLKGISKLSWQTFFRVCTQYSYSILDYAFDLLLKLAYHQIHWTLARRGPSAFDRAQAGVRRGMCWPDALEGTVTS